MLFRFQVVLLLAVWVMFFGAAAFAADDRGAVVSGDFVAEWQNEYRASSDDQNIDGTNNSFVRAELAPRVNLGAEVYVDGVFVFEPFDQVAEVNAGNDIWFDREGVFVEEIKLNYEAGPYALWAGKFNPAFGKAWDYGRGIWGEDFAEDYEITERIGVGASYALDSCCMGAHVLSLSTFFADTSVLSRGLVTARDQVHLSDGGVSNTQDLSSFALGLEGQDAFGARGFGYGVFMRHLGEQDKNRTSETADENGFDAYVEYTVPAGEGLSFDLFGEYAALRGFEGVENSDRDYVSASVRANIGSGWNVTAAYTLRDVGDDGAGDSYDDHLAQLSAGYDFGNGLSVEAGWREAQEAGQDTNIVGSLLRYTRSF